MVNIPAIPAPQQTYSRFRRQSKSRVLKTDLIAEHESQKYLLGRRKGDRRKYNTRVSLDRRTIHNRRNKQFTRNSTTIRDTRKAQRKGSNINTTA
jgi:hypothetical protein